MNENSDQKHRPNSAKRLLNTQSLGVFLVIAYFCLASLWCFNSSPVLQQIKPALLEVMNTCGLKQNWALFGPKTGTRNMHHLVKIRFSDGTVKLYEWPRVDNADLLKKSDYEPYSKLLTDNIPADYSAPMRVSLARFIVKANLNPENQPEYVTLIDVIGTIPDPFIFYNHPLMPPHTVIATNYVYRVQPKDLQ